MVLGYRAAVAPFLCRGRPRSCVSLRGKAHCVYHLLQHTLTQKGWRGQGEGADVQCLFNIIRRCRWIFLKLLKNILIPNRVCTCVSIIGEWKWQTMERKRMFSNFYGRAGARELANKLSGCCCNEKRVKYLAQLAFVSLNYARHPFVFCFFKIQYNIQNAIHCGMHFQLLRETEQARA